MVLLDVATKAARVEGVGNRGGGGNWPGPGPRMAAAAFIIIMALAFSAWAAAWAMRLLFSASLNKGDLNRKEGSMPGGCIP